METWFTLVDENIKWLEGFKVISNFFFLLSIFLENDTTEDDKTIVWGLLVKLQLLFGCINSGQN